MDSVDEDFFYEDIKRVKRTRGQAREHYDEISTYYDLLEGIFEKKYRHLGLDLLKIKENECILEIGYGTGQALVSIAKSVSSEGSVVGIDLSSKMSEASKERLKNKDLFENVELVCGDAVTLPFKEDHFDKIFLSFTLELFDTPEIPKVIKEMRRVLKKEGNLGVVSLSKEDDFFVHIYEVFHDLFPKRMDCRPIHVDKVLEKEGFSVEEVRKERIGVLPVKAIRALYSCEE